MATCGDEQRVRPGVTTGRQVVQKTTRPGSFSFRRQPEWWEPDVTGPARHTSFYVPMEGWAGQSGPIVVRSNDWAEGLACAQRTAAAGIT